MPNRSSVTAGSLRKELEARRAPWRIDPTLKDTDLLPVRSTGGLPPRTVPPGAAKPDFKRMLAEPVANPMLARERAARSKQLALGRLGPLALPPLSPAAARSVDWRDRWGWPWITKARDQGACANCWAFAGTALVEAMVRIEHMVWAARSEADVLVSANATCGNSGNIQLALDAIQSNGIADRDCVPWVASTTTYHPLVDRGGRIACIPGYQYVGSIDDQKDWLENVGPLASQFYVWRDFMYGYGHNGEVYRWDSTQKPYTDAMNPGDEMGWHALLVVGFDDARGAWIVKNSWGTSWGQHGFGYVAYGQTEIDTAPKIGLRGTSPDGWCKRRLHNGGLLEGNVGALHNDFELVAATGRGQAKHWRRDNSAGHVWECLASFANDVARFEPTLIQSTYNGNFEVVYQSTEGGMRHWWYERTSNRWLDGGQFGPPDADGVAALIQSNYGAPGNLELVVRTRDGRLSQWWRANGSGGRWVDGSKFATNVAHSGAALVQTISSKKGNFHLVCVLADGRLQHWQRDNDAGGSWASVGTFGSGIASPPCMIESQFGATTEDDVGNFELCVAVGGKVQHWWRPNGGNGIWRDGGKFGHDVAMMVGLLQSSYGFALEAVVRRLDGALQHYWRDATGWHEGPQIDPPG